MNERVVHTEPAVRQQIGSLVAGLVAAVVMGAGALIWCFGLNGQLARAERHLALLERQNVELMQKQDSLGAGLRTATETLGQSVGITQKQIDVEAELLALSQGSMKAQAAKLEKQQASAARQQAATAKQIGAVATDVSAVKTDVGGAKASIAETQNDLASTKLQLQRTIGDAGVMSGLIARNHDELDQLRHRGDRSYYEFTLQKGAKPVLIATIKLQVKKVDDKHSKYTVFVNADDRTIEKKDRSLDEPVQFYTGKNPVLYELVVNNIAKNVVSGYLSVPKSAGSVSDAPPR